MLAYYFSIALRGLKYNLGLTVLMVAAIGFGVGASTTTYAVFRAVSGDPIPWKSARLYVPQIDAWGPTHAIRRRGEPPDALSYLDATRLMRDHRAPLQAAIYAITPLVTPADGVNHPFDITGHAVSGEFFPMLDVPFHYGNGWASQDDDQRAAVAVISDKLNRKLFEGKNSVGRTLNLQGKDYRIVGVLDTWNPQPRFYDIMDTETGGFTGQNDDVFVPFNTAVAAPIENDGFTMCAERPPAPTFAGHLHSSCVWIAYMVQLDNASQVSAYQNYLVDYARDQQQAGRFGWAPNVRLRSLIDWLDYHHVVPGDTRLSFLVALGLLLVCLANSAGILLGKFLRRDSEIAIRRTLGATRSAIYIPCFMEAALVGLAGGVVGLILTWLSLQGLSWLLPQDIAALVHLDMPLLLFALAIGILGTLLAALYPAWRVTQSRLVGWSANRRPLRLRLPPALSVLHRHKVSVSLIVLQIMLSLAIVANALFIIQQRLAYVSEPTGLDEQNLFLITQQWSGGYTDSPEASRKLDSLLQADLRTLRNLPDVAAVTPVSALPLMGTSSNVYLNTKPLQQQGEAFAGLYNGDESTSTTLGLQLVAGRDFSADDVKLDSTSQPVIILSRALAEKLFPGTSALGKNVYLNGGSSPSRIVGMVDLLRVSSLSGQEASSRWYSVLLPLRQPAVATLYAVRAKPGRLVAAMHAAAPALYADNAARVMDENSVTRYADIRATAYRADIGMAVLMSIVSVLLLVVTGAGVAGLSSAWVSERRQQIGIRRALGASARDILRHFRLENLAITGLGIIVGIGLAFGLNKVLMSYFETNTLPLAYVLIGAAIVAAIGQCAVHVPARQASKVSPAVVMR